ncbi:DUF2254 domain-containing protein [Paenarthrobacter sp. Z7-10]|uniref:DUF2254 domain-containing protein n=1 Tax=Paenarthrobacter sp. Z7-10 TaxID=2787635 RepID=UPI0022A9D942|nr:DUF2254 domain-containing protein [Paenarthrobacter sp. Z7-10]MCZ2401898.1 DUF2254 domain-containing protein [Paenarthrobacter sp. Z7-10]
MSGPGRIGYASWSRLRDTVQSTFWLVPAACVVISIALAIGLTALDHSLAGRGGGSFLFPGPPEAARAFLSAITGAMISFTGLVFSITIVVLQLTSGQFSPRVLRIFLRDRTVRYALGIFIATFVFAMVVQRAVLGTSAHEGFVPRIAVSVAFGFVLASVGLFIGYLARISNMIRVSTILAEIGAEARSTLDRRYPAETDSEPANGQTAAPETGRERAIPQATAEETEPALPETVAEETEPEPAPGPAWTVAAPRAGVVVSVNESALVRLAAEASLELKLTLRVGDFLPANATLFAVSPAPGSQRPDPDRRRELQAEILAHLAQDHERTTEQDLAFSFRQLVDIIERALSPAVNDPTTACQGLDVLHDLLRQLGSRHLPTGRWLDDDGVLRLTVPQYSYADFLDLAVGEVWHYGSDAAQVPARLVSLLADLNHSALPVHLDVVRRWARTIGAETTQGATPLAPNSALPGNPLPASALPGSPLPAQTGGEGKPRI